MEEKVGWNVKWYGKYERKLRKDMENSEENCEMLWKFWKKSKFHVQKSKSESQ
jgi:hypothetical protein